MGLPGLASFAPVRSVVVPHSSAGFTLLTELGTPTTAIRYNLIVEPAGYVGAPHTGLPCIDGRNLPAGTQGIWFIQGDVIAVGGQGGDGGAVYALPDEFGGGGGGGGAGYAGGVGGSGHANGTDGSPGGTWPTTTGGAAGSNSSTNADHLPEDAQSGYAGGDAIWLNHFVTIVLSGNIGGGGGGGAGASYVFPGSVGPGAGGALGQVGIGAGAYSGGVAGYAIRLYDGIGAPTVTGAGTVYGTIG